MAEGVLLYEEYVVRFFPLPDGVFFCLVNHGLDFFTSSFMCENSMNSRSNQSINPSFLSY